MDLNTNDNIDLTIEKLVYGNYGLAHYDKLVVFVPYSLPGEKINVKIVSRKKDYAIGQITTLLKASEARVLPPCPIYELCGGCHYQHIRYNTQVELKRDILADIFSRIPGISDIETAPLIGSPSEFHYRNRTSLKVKERKKGYRIGFYQKGSHKLVEVKKCILLQPALNETIEKITCLLKNKDFLTLKIKDINLHYSSTANKVLISIYMRRYDAALIKNLLSNLNASIKKISGIVIYTPKKRMVLEADFNTEQLDDGIKLRISDRSFSQVNWQQNNVMIEKALSFAQIKGDENILELYSGIGNFSLPFSKKTKGLLKGIEGSTYSFNDGIYNTNANNIKNCRFFNETAQSGIKKMLDGRMFKRVDILLLNPPRAGAAKDLLKMIKEFSPRKIIYISCDPATLARDIKILCDEDYRLNKIQSFDFFPQTYHIETIAELLHNPV